MRAIIFENQNMPAADMAHYAHILASKRTGVSKGLSATYSGSTISILSGKGMICGRLFAVDGTDTIAAPEIASGTLYCRLVCEVDLSKTSTQQACNQIYWKILTNADNYPSLTQQNLDNYRTNGIYQMPLYRFTVTSGGISNFTDERAQFDTFLTTTLIAGNYTATIYDSGITANSIFDIYTETLSDGTPVIPVKQIAGAGYLTLQFDVQTQNVGIKVKVVG